MNGGYKAGDHAGERVLALFCAVVDEVVGLVVMPASPAITNPYVHLASLLADVFNDILQSATIQRLSKTRLLHVA